MSIKLLNTFLFGGGSVDFADLNWVAIFFAAIANIFITAIWYSPPVCGKVWLRALNIKQQSNGQLAKGSFLIVIGAFVMATVLALLIEAFRAFTPYEGIKIAVLAWVGFIASTNIYAVTFAKKPFNLFVISAGCDLVSLVIMGAIIGYEF